MLWLTSDTHFGCENLIKEIRKVFSSTKEHDAILLDNINKRVARNDRLVIAGDFCYGRPFKYRQAIICRDVWLVAGNHDKPGLSRQCFGTDRVKDRMVIKHGVHCIIVSHYPEAYWWNYHRGSLHIYGHVHGKYENHLDSLFPGRRSMDIGVDCHDFCPVSGDYVVKKLVSNC